MEQTFELKSFKVEKIGVDCKYILRETDDDGVVTEQEFHVKVSRPIHPDLQNLFDKDLTGILADILDCVELQVESAYPDSKIIAKGISFAGKGENIGIGIVGGIDTKFGRVTLKTPRIKYLASDSEVAAKLTVFADAVIKEVDAYLFGNKTAEMEVFGE